MNSRHKLNDFVILNFGINGILSSCWISGINFKNGKILYDISIKPFKNENFIQILENIDSYFVEKPYERFTNESQVGLNLCKN